MRHAILVWNGYRYFDYEREFAKREVESLTGCPPLQTEKGLLVYLGDQGAVDLGRLTYFREIALSDGQHITPTQTLLERSARRNGNGSCGAADRIDGDIHRQVTRYSAHGIHEYRGKFNPQVVRAIGNMMNLRDGAWVLDPFCGSGTTLLECVHSGWNAVGLDLNPLGVLISNAKVTALHTPPIVLHNAAQRLLRRLSERTSGLSYDRWDEARMIHIAGQDWRARIPSFDYLASWFPEPVLAQFSLILEEINLAVEIPFVPIFQVILSDLVRSVSLQDPADLRIRRRKDASDNYPVVPMFIESVSAKVGAIVRAREILRSITGHQEAFVADSRQPLDWIDGRVGRDFTGFDGVITSPPYATALPYVDTQRLSLCLLGLAMPRDITRLNRALIGTREITQRRRQLLESQLQGEGETAVPPSVAALCRHLSDLALLPGNGFRRRNMPALLFGYFHDMARVFSSVRSVVKPNGLFALVVGRNRTTLGGKTVVIDTPRLLGDVAEANGWHVQEMLEMNAYQRFDIHRRNSIRTETLVVLKRD